MISRHRMAWILSLMLLLAAGTAHAYIGPGAGISFLGSFFAAIVAVFAAIFAILLWPIRYMIRRFRRLRAGKETTAEQPAVGEDT